MWVFTQYGKQRLRGTEGFGFYNKDTKHLIKTPKERKIISNLKRRPGSEILFHHRWPTSTKNVPNACHPFSTKKFFSKDNGYSGTTYILAHNGIISHEKATKCKEEHEKLGISYQSNQPDGKFNDSEALLWDLALVMEGKKQKLDAGGSIAFIMFALNEVKGDQLYFGRNHGNPLNMELDDNHLHLSSEGEGTVIEVDNLYNYDYKDGVVYKNKMDFPTSYSNNYNSSAYTRTREIGKASDFTHTHTVNPTTEETTNPPKNVLESREDMVWDEATQTMWIRDEDTNDWVEWDEMAAKYAQKSYEDEEDEELRRMDRLAKEEEEEAGVSTSNNWNELIKEGEAYARERAGEENDPEENIPLDNISPTLAKSEGLKAKTNVAERQADVKKRYGEYLDSNVGNYHLAYLDACKDLEWLQDEYSSVLASDKKEDKDLFYEVSITQSIVDGLLCCPEWVDSSSIATGYNKQTISDAIDTVINVRRRELYGMFGDRLPQTKLALGTGKAEEEEKPITDAGLEAFRNAQQKLLSKSFKQ